MDYLKDVKTIKAAEGVLGAYCVLFKFGKSTCKNVISAYANGYLQNAFAVTLKPDFICGAVLQTCAGFTAPETVAAYATSILANKPALDNDYIQTTFYDAAMGIVGSRAKYKILHLTDLHVDYKY